MPATQSAALKREAQPTDRPATLPPLDRARLYRVKHAAAYLDVSVSYAYKLVRAGQLRTVAVGGQRVSGAEIERIANQNAAEVSNA